MKTDVFFPFGAVIVFHFLVFFRYFFDNLDNVNS